MSPARKKEYKNLPKNLYFDKTNKIFKYKHPITGKPFGLGRDEDQATEAAHELNARLEKDFNPVAKVLGTNISLYEFIINTFEPHSLPQRKAELNLSEKTIKEYTKQLNVIKKQSFALMSIEDITLRELAAFLKPLGPFYANRLRSLLSIVFQAAIDEGLTVTNPAILTKKRFEVKTRLRITLEQFNAIYQYSLEHFKEEEQWLRNAMDLALITTQRLEEIVMFKRDDIKKEVDQEDGGLKRYLYVVQKKTKKHGEGAYIRIEIGDRLQVSINRCIDATICPYLVHKQYQRHQMTAAKTHQFQVLPDYLSKAFAKARDRLPMFRTMKASKKPTFHELRALGIKLYEDAGMDTKNISGHETEQMQKKYKKGHGIVWRKAVSF